MAAVRAGAQDLGQLAPHGLPAGANALAESAELAELGSVLHQASHSLSDHLPTLPSGDLPLGL